MSGFPLYYHPLYSDGLDASARFPVQRYRLIAERLAELDGGGKIEVREPRPALREEILLAHDEGFVDRFLAFELNEGEIRRIGLRPWKKEIVPRTMRLVGGALEGLFEVLDNGLLAGNMAGGTHHAFRDCGAGYCIFNDLAICAFRALTDPRVNRILILDLDVHQGDGTAEILKDEEGVHTVSLHGEGNFPFRKKISDLDVAFANGTGDEEYLCELGSVLRKLSGQGFDLVFLQAGVDGLTEDGLGLLDLTRPGLRERNRMVLEWRRREAVPMLIFMGGGYSSPIDHTVEAFCDLFLAAGKEFADGSA